MTNKTSIMTIAVVNMISSRARDRAVGRQVRLAFGAMRTDCHTKSARAVPGCNLASPANTKCLSDKDLSRKGSDELCHSEQVINSLSWPIARATDVGNPQPTIPGPSVDRFPSHPKHLSERPEPPGGLPPGRQDNDSPTEARRNTLDSLVGPTSLADSRQYIPAGNPLEHKDRHRERLRQRRLV